ncbi:CLUMA_CG014621, isoform A [Clunio marinus]|uniref:CLUMA_CG014621, isoform A n=1 Tax=Clunio marinus TaxID=568069 RepID=A0A1J1IS68_9DIPT|nr:CLUMA_CG014621, isoform A [Clunio marinus]
MIQGGNFNQKLLPKIYNNKFLMQSSSSLGTFMKNAVGNFLRRLNRLNVNEQLARVTLHHAREELKVNVKSET